MLDSSKKNPNNEQSVAINHFGGKILSAGAGSGKTFVLIEHIIFLLTDYKTKHSRDEWSFKLPYFLQKIVLMTFTKKAAGEMNIRLKKKVEELCLEEGDVGGEAFWHIVRDSLSQLNVMTISSFCLSLITQGYFENKNSDIVILSDVEFKLKISDLFNEWFTNEVSRIPRAIQANTNALIESMISIFSNPELRVYWDSYQIAKNASEELDHFLSFFLQMLDPLNLLSDEMDLMTEKKEESKGWFKFLSGYEHLKESCGEINVQNIDQYGEWIDNLKPLPRIAKSMNEKQLMQFSILLKFVKEFRDFKEDLIELRKNEEVYYQWSNILKDLYLYIKKNYFKVEGFTYSDLEYYTHVGLLSEQSLKKISDDFDYFIVDEFQDTSSLQYEILKKVTNGSKNKIFCVGDRKQAIYGFRGGEVLVFNQCIDYLGSDNNLIMKNNFRSLKSIVDFNNLFFSNLFPLGFNYEGVDEFNVVMEEQQAGKVNEDLGRIICLKTKIETLNNEKLENLDFYEAQIIFNEILVNIDLEEIGSICILYKKLKASSSLIELLAANNQSFTAQVKISFEEDPIISLFVRMMELKLNALHKEKERSTLFLIDKILLSLGCLQMNAEIHQGFIDDLNIAGLDISFQKLLVKLGISNAFYPENIGLINSICKICLNDLEKVYNLISQESDQQYSFQLVSGISKKQIRLMTVHSSKGLEFDSVILAGVHTDGSSVGNRNIMGKWPNSFKWKRAFNQKSFIKSPNFILEERANKNKEFSESKRLMYVALTRAMKRIAWVDLWSDIKGIPTPLYRSEASWIQALRIPSEALNLVEYIDKKIEMAEVSNLQSLSLLLRDNVGIVSLKKSSSVGFFAETSVTRLAQLAQCPFKFYLSEICKIDPNISIGTNLHPFHDFEEEDEFEIGEIFSSKERGTEIHLILSKLYKNQMSLESLSIELRVIADWVLGLSSPYKINYEVKSEEPLKFSLFGQMITGTPDLTFENEKELIVWDFKTGGKKIGNEEHYWFQLYCYAYAKSTLNHFTPEKKITMSLLYLDELKVETRELCLDEISTFLFEVWKKTECLSQVNSFHCQYCEYSSICHKTKK